MLDLIAEILNRGVNECDKPRIIDIMSSALGKLLPKIQKIPVRRLQYVTCATQKLQRLEVLDRYGIASLCQ